MWGDGNELREFIYINDVVNIIDQIIDSEFEGILNIASGKSYSYSDVVRIIQNTLCLNVKVDSRERSKDKVNHLFSSGLINKVLNKFKFTNLESGMKSMYDSMQDQHKGEIS